MMSHVAAALRAEHNGCPMCNSDRVRTSTCRIVSCTFAEAAGKATTDNTISGTDPKGLDNCCQQP